MRSLRGLLWALVALAIIAFGYLMFRPVPEQPKEQSFTFASIGGPFTLTGADGKPFSSSANS